MEQSRRRRFAAIFVPALVGLSALFTVISRPRFQTYQTVDVIELVASGLCFGVAFVGLVWMLKGKVD